MNMPTFIEVASYVASLLVFIAFFMKAILPLRIVAIASNLAFIVYALGAGLVPAFVLHTCLLPLNALRIVQHLRLLRRVRAASEGVPDFDRVLPLMEREDYAAGDVIFRLGDPGRSMRYLEKGRVRFDEVGAEIGSGEIFGEIAMFLDKQTRTATATCLTDCTVYRLSKDKVIELTVLEPGFGLFLTRLMAERLQANVEEARRA
jgi:CRP/FNR family cyclic AMP-dependent transcriptional regulator